MPNEPLLEGEPVTCLSCGDRVEPGEYKLHQSKTYCEDCYEQIFVTCRRCGLVTEEDDSQSVVYSTTTTATGTIRRNRSSWCGSCRSGASSYCHVCDEYYANSSFSFWEYGHNGEDGMICSVCIMQRPNDFFGCYNCGNYFMVSRRIMRGTAGYCQWCYERFTDENWDKTAGGQVYDYSHKPRPVFFPPRKTYVTMEGETRCVPGTPRYFGVELEVNTPKAKITEHATQTIKLLGNAHVYLKQDSTIKSGGFEIVTHPHTLEEHRKLWEKFFRSVPIGMSSYDKGECGMHVHVGKIHLTPVQMAKAMVFLNDAKNRDFMKIVAQRDSRHSKFREKRLTYIRKGENYNERYECLNILPRTTIEFRLFRGTVRGDRFFKNLEFTDAVLNWVNAQSLKDLRYEKFVEWVRINRGLYPTLFAYLVEKSFTEQPRMAPGSPPIIYAPSEEVYV